MLADLQCVCSQFDIVVDQCENRRKWPDDTPDCDVAKLSDHFGVIGYPYTSARAPYTKSRKLLTEQGVFGQLKLPLDLSHKPFFDVFLRFRRCFASVRSRDSLFDGRLAFSPFAYELHDVR